MLFVVHFKDCGKIICCVSLHWPIPGLWPQFLVQALLFLEQLPSVLICPLSWGYKWCASYRIPVKSFLFVVSLMRLRRVRLLLFTQLRMERIKSGRVNGTFIFWVAVLPYYLVFVSQTGSLALIKMLCWRKWIMLGLHTGFATVGFCVKR